MTLAVESNLASRTDRLYGQFLDALVGGAPILLGAALLFLSTALGGFLMLAGVAWFMFYNLFADGLHSGQSFGKRWIGMRVIDAKTGAACTFGQSFVRNLLLTILGPIDWVFIFGERHQRLGDMAADTIVVLD
jgi:uncharacterized RDD family membrane protein YckC